MSLPINPESRLEQYLERIATGEGEIPDIPDSRLEQYLDYLCKNGSGGGLPDPTLLPAGSVLVGDGAEWKPQDGYGYTGKQLKFETSGYGPSYMPVTPPHPELTYKALHSTTAFVIDFTPMSVVYNWDGSEHPFTYDDTLGYYVFDEGFIYDWGASLDVWVQDNVLPEDESARTVKVYENATHQIDIKYVPGVKQMFSTQIMWMMTDYYITFPDAPNFIRAVNAAGGGWAQKVGIYNAISLGDGDYDMASMSYTINVALLLQLQSGEPVVYLFNMTRDPDAPNFHQIGRFDMSAVLPTAGEDGTGIVSVGGRWVKQAGYPVDVEVARNTASAGSPSGEYTPFTVYEYELLYKPSSIKYSWDGSIHEVTKNSQGVLNFDDGYILTYPSFAFMYWKVMVKTSAIPSYVTNPSVTIQERTFKKFDPSFVPWPPYKSLRRLASYTYEVTFDTIPEDTDANLFTASGCSSVVSNGRLYSNLDWKYNNNVIFHVKCNGFEGMAFSDRLTEGALDDDLIGQLPYHIRDGRNDAGIMVATHVVYNDLGWTGASSGALFTRIPITKLPYKVLTEVSNMSAFESWCTANLPQFYDGWLGRLETYALQFIVTDGTTTYVITMTGTPQFNQLVCVNATNNPKLTNFYWVNQSTISSRASLSQAHPTGIERWNALRTWGVPDMAGIRFTQSYERTDRLSDFIGESGTTKDSTDAELLEIRDLAYTAYQNRTRNGETWQTVYSVVYSPNKLETLYIQEDFETKVIGEDIEFALDGAEEGDVLVVGHGKRVLPNPDRDYMKIYPPYMVVLYYSENDLYIPGGEIIVPEEDVGAVLMPSIQVNVVDALESWINPGRVDVYGFSEEPMLMENPLPFTPRVWFVDFIPEENTVIKGFLRLEPMIVDDEFVGGRITYQPLEHTTGLPDVTAADNGKFLRVVDGEWVADLSKNSIGYITTESFRQDGDSDNDVLQRALNNSLSLYVNASYNITAPLTVRDGTTIIGDLGSTISSHVNDYLFIAESGDAITSITINGVRFQNAVSASDVGRTETETIAGSEFIFYKGFIFDTISSSTITNCRFSNYEGFAKSIKSCTTITNNRFIALYKCFIYSATDSFIYGNYINAVPSAALRTFSYTYSGTTYTSTGTCLVVQGLNSTTFSHNFCDYWRTCFVQFNGHNSSVSANDFDDCISVFRMIVSQLAITGNTFSNIRAEAIDEKWDNPRLTAAYKTLLKAERFGIFVFDSSVRNPSRPDINTRQLLGSTFVGNIGRDVEWYVNCDGSTTADFLVKNCKFDKNLLYYTVTEEYSGTNVDRQYEAKAFLQFKMPTSTFDKYKMLEGCYFDFWDDRTVDSLPSPSLTGNAVVTHKLMRVYMNGILYTNIDGAWVSAHDSTKQDKNLGAAHAGEFLVVGADGNITSVAMTAWEGGLY